MADRLSEHLTLSEVTYSETAKRLGIPNVPTTAHIASLVQIATHIFEPVRIHFGQPIHVSSGYRSKALNDATPGASATSQHSLGEALDLDQDGKDTGVTNRMVFEYIRASLPFDQLIWEYGDDAFPDWVHVSYRPQKRRREVLRAHRDPANPKGRPRYATF